MNYDLISQVQPGKTKIETILSNRGIQDIEHYLNTTENDILDPSTIAFIDEGIKKLAEHIGNNDDIYLIVDEDADGFSSSSLFLNYLHNIFPSYVENHIIYDVHDRKMHGVETEKVPPWVKLVMIIDAGSNQFEEHEYFYNNGIDVIVVDHHECVIPKGYNKAIVINNNATYEDFENPYKTKSLCGCGMIYKFCCRFDELLGYDFAKNYRDQVALAEIADMMNMQDFETVELTRQGLDTITNPFIVEMMNKNKARFTEGITQTSIAFYVVPYINAVTRVGSKEDRKTVFESMLEYKANVMVDSTKRGHKGEQERFVEQAVRLCSNLKQTKQSGAVDIGYSMAEGLIREHNLLNDKFIIIQFDKGIVEADINGLIANKLMSKYQRPVLVLQPYEDAWAGSGRGYDKSGLESFRDFLENSGLVNFAQGHANAFGTSIPKNNIEALKEYAKETLKDIDFTPNYQVDFIWDINRIKPNDIYEVADYNYLWGQNIEEPLIAIENVKINADSIKFLGASESTLRITSGDLSFVKFNIKEDERNILNPGTGNYVIDIVGRCERNIYNGNSSPQIMIEDYRIRNRNKYYF